MLNIPKPVTDKETTLNIITEIVVYGDEIITFNQSGLTMPFKLKELKDPVPERVKFHYRIDENPGIRVNDL